MDKLQPKFQPGCDIFLIKNGIETSRASKLCLEEQKKANNESSKTQVIGI
jgi:hypothetical protein